MLVVDSETPGSDGGPGAGSPDSRVAGDEDYAFPEVRGALIAFQRLQLQNSRMVARAAADLGIRPVDLRALADVGADPRSTPKRLAEFLDLTTSAVTSLIDRLAEAELLFRKPNPEDRRSVLLELTPLGLDAIARIRLLYREAFAQAIDPAQVECIERAFGEIAEALKQRSTVRV